jgi:tRNA-dihydrouridine synthase 4
MMSPSGLHDKLRIWIIPTNLSAIRQTIDFLHTVIGHPQNRQVDFLTIHPRTRSTPSTTPINAESLKILTSTFGDTLPILLSGDVFSLSSLPLASQITLEDTDGAVPDSTALYKPSNTKLAGFMSARGLLANPGLFAGYEVCSWDVVETFMNKVARSPLPLKLTLHHLNEMCGPGMGSNKQSLLSKQERLHMLSLPNMVDVVDFIDEKVEKRNQVGGLRRNGVD